METSRGRREKELSQNFAHQVKASVNDYFEQNRLSRHANAAMISKTVVLVARYLGSYGLIMSGLLPLPWLWFLCLVMGIAMAGIGFAVTHDAPHGAYSASPCVWYVGGLNYQIEHHLFMRVCHVHDRQLSPIAERLAAQHGAPTTAARRSLSDPFALPHAEALWRSRLRTRARPGCLGGPGARLSRGGAGAVASHCSQWTAPILPMTGCAG